MRRSSTASQFQECRTLAASVKRERKKRPGGGDIVLLTEFDESSTMDYLHGDVVDGEQGAACAYEYSREAPVLAEAAKLCRELEAKTGRPAIESIESVAEEIEQRFSCGGLILQSPWLDFIICKNCPQTPWNSLPAEDRAEILTVFPVPLGLMADLRRLDNIFDALKALAQQARADSLKTLKPGYQPPKRRSNVPPILVKEWWMHALFTFDRRETEAQLIKDFRSFLRDNRERFKECRDNPSGKTGGTKDMLKALAAWRLLEHCGGDWKKTNNSANEHRKVFEKPAAVIIGTRGNRKKIRFEKGDPKPFHDPRRGQGKQQINKVSLYNEEKGFLKAKERAHDYLKQLVPAEFFKVVDDAVVEKERLKQACEQLPSGHGAKEVFEMLRNFLNKDNPDPDQLALEKLKEDELKRVLVKRKSRPPSGQS